MRGAAAALLILVAIATPSLSAQVDAKPVRSAFAGLMVSEREERLPASLVLGGSAGVALSSTRSHKPGVGIFVGGDLMVSATQRSPEADTLAGNLAMDLYAMGHVGFTLHRTGDPGLFAFAGRAWPSPPHRPYTKDGVGVCMDPDVAFDSCPRDRRTTRARRGPLVYGVGIRARVLGFRLEARYMVDNRQERAYSEHYTDYRPHWIVAARF